MKTAATALLLSAAERPRAAARGRQGRRSRLGGGGRGGSRPWERRKRRPQCQMPADAWRMVP